MTFLQPLALYGLPLALLPVIIHLLNLLRHRSQPWAAMRFLMEARQSSSKISRIKRWLTLLFRVLALAGLALLLSRPMTGGDSVLSFSSGAPEAVALVLDRSASMEARSGDRTESKRERAIEALKEYAKSWSESRIVLIDTAFREPVILSDLETLSDEAMERYLGPTDTAANLPATLETTLNWLEENGVATSEIAVASDLQKSNWKPEGNEDAYKRIASILSEKEGSWKVRLLALDGEVANNATLTGESLRRKKDKLELLASLRRRPSQSQPLRILANANGSESEITAKFSGEGFLLKTSVTIEDQEDRGWLSLNLPPDSQPKDNSWYFAYGSTGKPKAAVKAESAESGRVLTAAAANSSGKPADTLPSSSLQAEDFAGRSLIILQGSPSNPEEGRALEAFVDGGGILVCFPPVGKSKEGIGKVRWMEIEKAKDSDEPFKVNSWNQNGGILANAADGTRLPVSELIVNARRIPIGAEPLAYYSDGGVFLARIAKEKGAVYLFSTLPDPEWSDLAGGYVLVPAIQRLLEETASAKSATNSLECGSEELRDKMDGGEAKGLDSEENKNPNLHAGVYEINGQLTATNRPTIEDYAETLDQKLAMESMGGEHVAIVNTDTSGNPASKAEIWNLFLYLALAFLLGESLLGLPKAEKNKELQTS